MRRALATKACTPDIIRSASEPATEHRYSSRARRGRDRRVLRFFRLAPLFSLARQCSSRSRNLRLFAAGARLVEPLPAQGRRAGTPRARSSRKKLLRIA